ncbi:misexpression suppressor of ras 4 [Arctopsyche grandis]|uniref:misexpression suppressor of ras 4 n=1 Tax=Arctopsyche grandis TaxID=121162 RepID=UPI00406D9BDB
MEDTGYHQLPMDKFLPGVSNLGNDVTLMRFQNHGGLNGGSDGSPKAQKLPPPIRERPFMGPERPKPAVVGETYIKKPEKKRPTTFMERMKWLKKFPNANMKKNKYTKISDAASFKNNLERRKALQHPKMFGTTLANGNHDLMKANINEIKEFEFPKATTIMPTNIIPKTMSSPVLAKNTLLINKGKFEGSSSFDESGIHYGNLQPSVTFKCRKCSCTSFESLEMLKEHQLHCSSQASSSETALESDPSNAGNSSGTGNRTARQVVLCSACGTYFANWNLFLHMREVHGRHICLFCLGLFSQADKLSTHLIAKHNVQVNCFKSKEEIVEKFTETFYLTCCKCELVFTQSDNYATHECTQVIRHCLSCNSKGGHKVDCPKNSKHKYTGHLDVDPNKKIKKNVANKQVYESPLNPSLLPPMDMANIVDRGPFAGFDIKPEKDISELSLLEGIGVNLNTLNALTYAVPDVKPEKISASSMALLIEEVKNCLSTTQPTPPPPPPPPVETEAEKLSNNDNTNVSNDVDINVESLQPTDSDVNLESQTNAPSDETKISSISNSSSNKNSSDSVNSVKSAANVQAQEKDIQSDTTTETLKEVNRVPKLTVKVPKVTSEKESSEYSSESEDSDKLTVDLEPRAEDPNVINEEKENLIENTEVKKCDASQDSETPGEDIPIIELTLDQPLDRYPLKDLLEVLLNASIYSCIYCNHARKIAVNGKQLGLHFISQHKFTATVNSITAEELLPETIVSKIRSCLQDVENVHINLDEFGGKTGTKTYDHNYECFQCYYVTTMHKDLYFHNRKMHQKSILLCIMCKSSFYTYSELICHLCPGVYILNSEILFRCCICRFEPIPSAFRLMVHLRKRHHACDVCLEICHNQSKLSSHVWKHKLHHLCYRCGIAYRNKPDITKHLFWKHGTESVLCKKCLQRKWPHVYHFCVPPNLFTCEECSLNFTKAVYLKVHKRIHTEEYPYECVEPNCEQKFISKKLLSKHNTKHTDSLDNERPPNNLDKSSSNNNGEIIDLCEKGEVASTNDTKSKKSKKSKSFKDNLLMDVNLPALNLSESGSSDDSDSEANKKPEASENSAINPSEENPTKTETTDESKPEPVQGIWDNFKLYQESLEKQIEKPHIPTHVCESDHDYCLIPTDESPDVEIVGEIKPKTDTTVSVSRDSSPKKKTKTSKKKGKSETISSSSDSSSDSDSCCSGTNCSCSSSSGSSSSSSSSDSSSTNSPKRRNNTRKDSDASHTSAIDIMAIGESPLRVSKSKDLSFAESDLDSDESATDEEFYDKHPEKIANKLLAEKRNQLIQSVEGTPINNGTYFESSRPPSPDDTDKLQRKKIKVKKRKKEKKLEMILESTSKLISDGVNIPILEQPGVSNKITISLQSNTVQLQESTHIGESMKISSGALSDADSKRASKRRRVPNKFYGYSSDEEHMMKPHQPPKLEWRKEDLPSPSVVQQESPRILPEIPRVPDITIPAPEPIVPMISPPKESSSEDSDSSKEGVLQIKDPYSPSEREPESAKVSEILPPVDSDIPFPRPTGAREAREGESVYCYCRCPYDEVSEMIACDADGCSIEWFHFECVGIMVPPKGKWFCPDCRVRQDNLHK